MPETITSPQQRAMLGLRDDSPQWGDVGPTVMALRALGGVAAEGAAKTAATEAADAKTNAKPTETITRTYTDADGNEKADVTHKGVDPKSLMGEKKPDQQAVQEAYDAPHSAVQGQIDALMHRIGRKLPGEGTHEDVKSWRGRYDLEREQGQNPIKAAAWAAIRGVPVLQPSLERGVDTQRLAARTTVMKEVLPLLQEQHRQTTEINAERKLANSEKTQTEKERQAALSRLLTSKELHTLGDDEDSAVMAADRFVPGGLKGDLGAVRLQYRRDVKSAEKARVDEASKTINGISEKAIQVTEDPKAYVESLPGADKFTPQEKKKALGRAIASQKTLRKMDAKDRAQIDAMRSRQVTAGGSGRDDAKSIAQAIIDGDQPPDLKGLYRMNAPVRAELQRQGYNFTKANEEWQATTKFLSAANGPQQLKIRQSIDNVDHTLGTVQELVQEWKAGQLGILNKTRMALAVSGALGEKAQSTATRMQSAINDSVSEMAGVYMGGNSPTDHAMDLAKSNLNANWSEKTMIDAIAQTRKFIGYRKNAINSSGPIGTDGNRYNRGGGGGGEASGPAVGDTKKFPNGNVGRFDGRGWVKVSGGK